jgi:hypothetical protein
MTAVLIENTPMGIDLAVKAGKVVRLPMRDP